jgi:hypothetical protein
MQAAFKGYRFWMWIPTDCHYTTVTHTSTNLQLLRGVCSM